MYQLFSRRKRLNELAEQEAQGKSVWTESFDERARVKILHAFDDSYDSSYNDTPARIAHGLILRNEGLTHLVKSGIRPLSDLLAYAEKCDDSQFPDVVEAMYYGIKMHYRGSFSDIPETFATTVKEVLLEHRIGYDFIDDRLVEFSSREMHVAVVEPTLHLLGGEVKYSRVENAYRDALKEISEKKGSNAITDAGTALQEMLSLLGCKGNALGPLIKDAANKGILARHDTRMLEGIRSIHDWVSADRSERGDAHSSNNVPVEDAWFIVHVVGAILLRLGSNVTRD